MDLNLCISNGTVSTKIHNILDNFDKRQFSFSGWQCMGYTYINLLDLPELLQSLVTLTAIIKPLLPNFLGRAIVILNLVRHFRNCIAHSALVEKYNVGLKTLLQ